MQTQNTPPDLSTPGYWDTIISAQALYHLLNDGTRRVLILDSSFELSDPAAGQLAYEQAHIPGAYYIHAEQILSSEPGEGRGRHPLPDAGTLTTHLASLGADNDTQIVIYDRSGGMFAARAWWLLHWLGHRASAVLDGGFSAWLAHDLPVSHTAPDHPLPGSFSQRAPRMHTITREGVLQHCRAGSAIILDARSPDRFRGENENMDPVAGHIPGAMNRFFMDNLDEDGNFKAPTLLAAEFLSIIDGKRPVISQCGSGITACHNLLSMKLAGLPDAVLYPGSWSEWCAHAEMPVETGNPSGKAAAS
ncbi:sulfurtransferase [Paracandidimonas soli]|uniref:Sulfurtransferase n=1 Tax=Paracandidimonas soli TaxID=1917182 RepID=A0A4R3VAT9_9BURK|nr:sulfurtransferase [Paracandidimonas soli]TCV00702.1 thiosulfate/3-mercaptopyruvate sulfurtransferase [Paracandidimonas soli]